MLILDFDGTLTDAEVEGRPFLDGYLVDLAGLAGAPLEEVRVLADRYEKQILESRGAFGWMFMGRIVAPASVDPYLRIMPVARMVFDHYGVFNSVEDRARLLEEVLYKYNYGKSGIAFRPGAFEFLDGRRGTPTWIVTNSATEAVQNKIRVLSQEGEPGSLDWLVERVYGFGKKYFIDDSFDAVPEAMFLPGLDRPVLLRRARYFEVLDRLRAEAGAEWSDVTVVGDIFELDLALPLHLGARIALMVNEFTPPWELEFLAGQERAGVVRSLAELPDFLGT